jgi:hypothetical protein
MAEGVTPGNGMNQSQFVKRGKVQLALYFERLPQCLGELPFVDKDNIPEFPRALERGIRPPGTFVRALLVRRREVCMGARTGRL